LKIIKMLLFLLASLFLCPMAGVSAAEQAGAAGTDAPPVEWSYTFARGEGHFVEQTGDGGLVMTGWVDSGGAGSDVFLARYDRAGSRLWLRTYRGNGYSDGHCVREVSGGGFIVVGETKSRDAYDHDVYVVRTDGKGVPLWEKVFGGARCDYAWSVRQTGDGGFILAGGTESFGAGIYDVYLVKLDAAGNTIWEKTYGGTASDCGYAVLQLNDGGYLIAGNTESFGAGNLDVYLLKTDSDGNIAWQKTYGGEGSDYGWSLVKAGDGGYLIAGEKEITVNLGGVFAAYLIKVGPEGNELWQNTYGDTRGSSFYDAGQVTGGGYILTGKKESAGGGYGLYVVKTNKNGDPVWEKTIEGAGSNSGYAVAQNRDGAYVVAGKKGIEKSAGSEVLLLKLKAESKSNGALLWPAGAAAVMFAGVLLCTRRYLSQKGRAY